MAASPGQPTGSCWRTRPRRRGCSDHRADCLRPWTRFPSEASARSRASSPAPAQPQRPLMGEARAAPGERSRTWSPPRVASAPRRRPGRGAGGSTTAWRQGHPGWPTPRPRSSPDSRPPPVGPREQPVAAPDPAATPPRPSAQRRGSAAPPRAWMQAASARTRASSSGLSTPGPAPRPRSRPESQAPSEGGAAANSGPAPHGPPGSSTNTRNPQQTPRARTTATAVGRRPAEAARAVGLALARTWSFEAVRARPPGPAVWALAWLPPRAHPATSEGRPQRRSADLRTCPRSHGNIWRGPCWPCGTSRSTSSFPGSCGTSCAVTAPRRGEPPRPASRQG